MQHCGNKLLEKDALFVSPGMFNRESYGLLHKFQNQKLTIKQERSVSFTFKGLFSGYARGH